MMILQGIGRFFGQCGGRGAGALQKAGMGQGGAMFGMDARIALLIAAILAAVGGWQMMSRLESGKTGAAEQQAEILRKALETYYQNVGINHLPDNLDELFGSNLVTDMALKKDPWGNDWIYYHTTGEIKVEGVSIQAQYAVIYSRGKNGVDDSEGFSSPDGFSDWEAQKDDIGVKYISRDTELQRVDDYRERAKLIIDKLEAAESAGYVEAQGSCTAESPPAWCIEGDKNYTMFNYYPKSDADTTSGVVYYSEKVGNKQPYTSGNQEDMEQLMADIGLPAFYAHDPWGRTLMYSSNVTGRTVPPFSASFCFSAGGEDCLANQQQ